MTPKIDLRKSPKISPKMGCFGRGFGWTVFTQEKHPITQTSSQSTVVIGFSKIKITQENHPSTQKARGWRNPPPRGEFLTQPPKLPDSGLWISGFDYREKTKDSSRDKRDIRDIPNLSRQRS